MKNVNVTFSAHDATQPIPLHIALIWVLVTPRIIKPEPSLGIPKVGEFIGMHVNVELFPLYINTIF